jgi:hypothetical protein
MKHPPLTNGSKPASEGRDARGRFTPGCPPGPGNPYAGRVARLREAGWDSVKPAEVKQVYRKLLALALAGDVQAARLLLDRLLGPPVELDLLERIETLEGQVKP